MFTGDDEDFNWSTSYKFGMHQMAKREYDKALINFTQSYDMEKSKTMTK